MMDDIKTTVDAVHQELHQVPLEYLSVPAHVHVVGYLRNRKTHQNMEDFFVELASQVGILAENISWIENRGLAVGDSKDGSLLLKLNMAEDHYTIQVWLARKDQPDFGRLPIYPSDFVWPDQDKLTELDIVWCGTPCSSDEINAGLESQTEILSSRIMGGKVQIATNYEPDSQGRERYLVFPVDEVPLPEEAEFVVDSIVSLENNFHLLYLPRENYHAAVEELEKIEAASAEEMNALNSDLPTVTTTMLKEHLHRLSGSFTELAALSDRFQRNFSRAINHKDILEETLAACREQALDDHLPLSAPLLRSATTISNDYSQLLTRAERVRKHKNDMINILRTKIELFEREQSIDLQRSMNDNVKSQIAMQFTIEGLYVFIVAFYLTELVHIVFEALEYQEIIHGSPYVYSAFFIPLAILAGLILSGKASHWLNGLRNRG